MTWADVESGYDLINGQTTQVCLVKFEAVPTANGRILCKRNSAGAASAGMDLSYDLPSGSAKVEWSDGVGEERIAGSTILAVGNTYLIIGRHSRNQADLWINGVMEGINAAPARMVGNNNDPVEIFNNPAIDDVTINADVAMAGVWTRALSNNEIARLNTDPYVMWQEPRRIEWLTRLSPIPVGGGKRCGCGCCYPPCLMGLS